MGSCISPLQSLLVRQIAHPLQFSSLTLCCEEAKQIHEARVHQQKFVLHRHLITSQPTNKQHTSLHRLLPAHEYCIVATEISTSVMAL